MPILALNPEVPGEVRELLSQQLPFSLGVFVSPTVLLWDPSVLRARVLRVLSSEVFLLLGEIMRDPKQVVTQRTSFSTRCSRPSFEFEQGGAQSPVSLFGLLSQGLQMAPL